MESPHLPIVVITVEAAAVAALAVVALRQRRRLHAVWTAGVAEGTERATRV